MSMATLLGKMVVFVVLMVTGYICARSNFAGKEFTRDASKLVINVFMCATIINSVLGLETRLTGRDLMTVLLVMTATILICYAVAAIACRTLPIEAERRPIFEQHIAVMNSMFIALPVLSELYGPQAVFYCSLSNIPYNLILYSYGTARLRKDGGSNLRDIISVPLVSSLVALVLFLIRPPVPGVVKDVFSTAANATMPLSMLVVGSSLGSVSLLDSFRDWRLYIAAALRLLLCPLLVRLAAGLITTDPILLAAAVMVAAAPTGIIVTVLSLQYGRDAVFASEGVLLTTCLSMVTIPVVIYTML